MSEFCTPLPEDRQKYIKDIGTILVDDYGKKDFYKPEEVKKASQKSTWSSSGSGGIDFSCWGMSVFSSHEDFDAYHKTSGEICDYAEMKQTMLEGISVDGFSFVPELSDADIDLSWLDIGDVFQGIGEFFASFLD